MVNIMGKAQKCKKTRPVGEWSIHLIQRVHGAAWRKGRLMLTIYFSIHEQKAYHEQLLNRSCHHTCNQLILIILSLQSRNKPILLPRVSLVPQSLVHNWCLINKRRQWIPHNDLWLLIMLQLLVPRPWRTGSSLREGPCLTHLLQCLAWCLALGRASVREQWAPRGPSEEC